MINRYSKTLGTENSRLFTTLSSQRKIVFSIADAKRVGGKSYNATQLALHRLTKAGWLVRLGAGRYALVPAAAGGEAAPEANRLVIARELAGRKYYISHGSALEIHNMLTRPVTSVTISTPRRIKSRSVLNVPYRFVTVKLDAMWGYRPVWVLPAEQVQVSDPERTVLDGLARPDLCGGVSEVATGLNILKDDLDLEKLAEYARRLENQAVIKRLGYLLEFYALGTAKIYEKLHKLIGPSYALLDPVLPAEGRFLAKWRLQLNIDSGLLRGVAST